VTKDSAMSYVDGVLAGTDTFDGNGVASELTKYKNNAAIAQAVRTAAKRVIYNVIRTNVMNGTTLTTRYVSVTPWWQSALHKADIGVGVVFGLCALMFVLSIPFGGKAKQTAGNGDTLPSKKDKKIAAERKLQEQVALGSARIREMEEEYEAQLDALDDRFEEEQRLRKERRKGNK
jgi:hypothetical protein